MRLSNDASALNRLIDALPPVQGRRILADTTGGDLTAGDVRNRSDYTLCRERGDATADKVRAALGGFGAGQTGGFVERLLAHFVSSSR